MRLFALPNSWSKTGRLNWRGGDCAKTLVSLTGVLLGCELAAPQQ